MPTYQPAVDAVPLNPGLPASAGLPADPELDAIRIYQLCDVLPPLDPAAQPGGTPADDLGAARIDPAALVAGGIGAGGLVNSGAAAGPVAPDWAGPPEAEWSWPQQFAVLLAETLAGVRPVQQVLPWLSRRGSAQLHRLLPLLHGEHRPRVLRVLTTMPSPDVIEMTMVVLTGPRARALAVRLERGEGTRPGSRPGPGSGPAGHPGGAPGRWTCTDIEAG